MPPDPDIERTEAARGRRAAVLGVILGAILAALARGRRPAA
jgi:hypothetical protein